MILHPDQVMAARETVFWDLLVPATEQVARLRAGGARHEVDPAAARLREACELLGRIGWPGDPAGLLALTRSDAERLRASADRRLGADRPPPSHGPVPAPVEVPSARAVKRALG